jgi:hypothetical protein
MTVIHPYAVYEMNQKKYFLEKSKKFTKQKKMLIQIMA